MSQAHIKTLHSWLPDIRQQNTVSGGVKVFLTNLAAVDGEEQGFIIAAAEKEYTMLAQALTENTPYSAAGSTTAKGGT